MNLNWLKSRTQLQFLHFCICFLFERGKKDEH
nr:MAG TPA: hypothetical protein [Caudoviricetes sp.]